MKRLSLILALILCFALAFASCGEAVPEKEVSESQTASQISNLSKRIENIGQTFEEMKAKHADYVESEKPGSNCSVFCFGPLEDSFGYAFYGAQSGPTFEQMTTRYAKRLKCAGIYTTVEQVFPFVSKDPQSVTDFLATLQLNAKNTEQVDFWNGWIRFTYQGYVMELNTAWTGDTTDAVPTVMIGENMALFLRDEEIWQANFAFQEEWMDEQISA